MPLWQKLVKQGRRDKPPPQTHCHISPSPATLSFVTRASAENPAGVLRLSIKGAIPRPSDSHTGLGHFAVNIHGAGQDPMLFSSIKYEWELGPLALLGILFPTLEERFFHKATFFPSCRHLKASHPNTKVLWLLACAHSDR